LQSSDNYQLLLGISSVDMVGKTMAELFPPEFAAKITADDLAVIASGEVLILDEEFKGRNYTSIKFPIKQGGKTLLAGYTIDITERKQAEEALRVAEADYRAIFERASVGIFRSTVDGRFLKVNRIMAEMFGYPSPEEMIDDVKSIAEQIYAEPEVRRDLTRQLTEHGEFIGFESLDRRKDGSLFWTSMNVRVAKNMAGEILYYEGFVMDITGLKQAEDALKDLNEQLNLRILQVENLQAEMHEQALHDPLTGLHNRRYLDETLAREITRAGRENDPISIIMIDIDHFKTINDTYGHSVGDKFLVEIANLMKNHARGSDIVCRFGGEEFLLVLPGTDINSAVKRAEEIRIRCAELILQHAGKDLNLTMSFGVASYPEHGQAADELIIKADNAMYRSKQAGRNRVTAWVDEGSSEKIR